MDWSWSGIASVCGYIKDNECVCEFVHVMSRQSYKWMWPQIEWHLPFHLQLRCYYVSQLSLVRLNEDERTVVKEFECFPFHPTLIWLTSAIWMGLCMVAFKVIVGVDLKGSFWEGIKYVLEIFLIPDYENFSLNRFCVWFVEHCLHVCLHDNMLHHVVSVKRS